MRLPNGYGSVHKLSGKRRNPWCVRKTKVIDESGKQKYDYLGYYKTQPEALKALAEFNLNPYDIKTASITFSEIYDKFSNEKFSKISKPNINGYKAAFKLSESLHSMKFVEIKKAHLQSVLDNCEKGHGTLRKIKVLFNQLFKYAMENDVITKDYSKFVELGKNEEESSREPFSEVEIKLLWDSIDRLDFVDTILIMIYTGLRPTELLLIKNSDINIEERYMRGGIKTTAGKNRVIPINEKILPFIENRKKQENEFMIINNDGKQMSYFTYYDCKFKHVMGQLQLNHKPHDCRHTFATLMDNAGANKLSIKRIMGHSSQDITDKVYTHKDIEELKKAIDLI